MCITVKRTWGTRVCRLERRETAIHRRNGSRVSWTPICLLVLTAGYVCAQPEAEGEGPAQVLGSFLEELDANNPALRSARQALSAAEFGEDLGRALPDPRVSMGVFVDEIETRLGPQELRLGVQQTVPWVGKRPLRTEIAREQAERRRFDVEALRLELFESFVAKYAEAYVLTHEIDLTREHRALLEETERVLVSRYEVGQGSYGQVLQIQVEIDRVTDRLTALQDRIEPLNGRLNALLGRDIHGPIEFPQQLPHWTIEQTEGESGVAAGDNPTLNGLDAAIRGRKLEVELEDLNRFPDPTVGLEWVRIGNTDLPVEDAGRDAWLVKLGFYVPLWGGKNRARVAQAKAHQMAAIWAREDEARRLAADCAQVVFEIEDRERKITLFDESLIPKAREALDVFLIGLESGEATYRDVLDAETQLLELQIDRVRMEAMRLALAAKLDRLLGRARGFAGSDWGKK